MPNYRKTGQYGVVSVGNNVVSAIQNWSFSDASTNTTLINSATRGGTARQEGVRDWSGSFQSNAPMPVVFPGDTFQFDGYIAPDSGVYGTTGAMYSGSAYLESIAFTIDIENNTPLSYTYTFNGNGPYEETSGVLVDQSTFNPISPRDIEITIDPLPAGVSGDECWQNTKSINLTISRPGATSADSCSIAEINGKKTIWRTRQQGGAIDVTGSWNVNSYQASYYPAIHDDFTLGIKWGSGNSEGWEIAFMQVDNFSGISVSPQDTTTIIGMTLNLIWNAAKKGGPLGHISYGGSNFWPETLPEGFTYSQTQSGVMLAENKTTPMIPIA